MNDFTRFSTTMIVASSLLAGCSADDVIRTHAVDQPSVIVEPVEAPVWAVSTITPTASVVLEVSQTVPEVAYILMGTYAWMQRSSDVRHLQEILEIETDGIYGPSTHKAHVDLLNSYGLSVAGTPTASGGRSYTAPAPVGGGVFWDNVERWRPIVTEAVHAWGGDDDDVYRFLRIMQCESAGLPDAKNPHSSASGLMQHLTRFWDDRAMAAGMPNADVFDPGANIWVSAWLALAASYGGWQHWECNY